MYCSLATRDRFLRLHDFDVAGDAGGEPIARLRQLLAAASSRARVATCSCSLLAWRSRNAVRDVVVDRRLQVLGLGAAVAEVGVGLEQAALCAAALEDRHARRAPATV